jgi:cation diffusion facilitator CzcD-associated flavoprotein CzcO
VSSEGRGPVLVVGAGPAGLATAVELQQRGVPYRLFERGPSLAHSWENAYDSLTLHTGKHMSALPFRPHARSAPLFLGRLAFIEYLRDYARRFELRVETGREVTWTRRESDGWRVGVSGHEVRGSALVMATGIMCQPYLPAISGLERFAGTLLHSVAYRRPDPFVGKRVLVVGVDVTIAIRSGANVVPLTILGVPIQYIAYGLRSLPRPVRQRIAASVQRLSELRRGPQPFPRPPWSALDAIPIIGFHLVDAVRAGKVKLRLSAIEECTARGVRCADGAAQDFDAIIMATGFRPALDALGDAIRRDEKGFALRTDRVTSADLADLYFVGHNYDATGAIANIARDAGLVAARIAARQPNE